ncbi:SLIT-ROBO Rho GTPase-activating protein 3-like [Rhinoraja longicauda]
MALQSRKREKASTEYDTQLKEIRGQLVDQLKCLDTQVECRTQCLQDMSDFFRRKAEVELEYSRGLEKLVDRFSLKIRTAKDHQGFRKEQAALSSVHCWHQMLSQTRQQSRDHGALHEILANLTLQLSSLSEDVSRITRKCKEVGQLMQNDLQKVTEELQTAVKTYHMYHLDCVGAESKLKEIERTEEKQGGGPAGAEGKGPRRGPNRKLEKMKEKWQERFVENELKSTKARNEYLLNLSAANATLTAYFTHNVAQLLDCWDLGFHSSLGHTLRTYLSAESYVQSTWLKGLQTVETAVNGLDPSGDQTKVMDSSLNAFCLPSRFEFLPHNQDKVRELKNTSVVHQELLARFQNLQGALTTTKLETDEINKTLRATLQALQSLGGAHDVDVAETFQRCQSLESVKTAGASGCDASSKASTGRRRANQQETETYYITKLKESVVGNARMTKLQAKYELLKAAIDKGVVDDDTTSRFQATMGRTQRLRRSRPCSQYNQKLFTGDLLMFITSTGQPLPLVVVSCVRFINLHGEYLFAFLNHLSQFSDENMMDPYNLAVCFGPTLVNVPDDRDPVACQAQVNLVVKVMIANHLLIFPGHELLPGPAYEKCMTEKGDYCDGLHTEPILEEPDTGDDELQALVQFDYAPRSAHELTLRKGEVVHLYERASNDWWSGQARGVKGLIPHKYIELLDVTDAQLEAAIDCGLEPPPSVEGTESHRLLSDSDHEPVQRKRSGSSPVRKVRGINESPKRSASTLPGGQRLLPISPPAHDNSKQGVKVVFQERRNTMDFVPTGQGLLSSRLPASKVDRQLSEKPVSELNKVLVKNMDLVFRELLQSRNAKAAGEGVSEPGSQRRGSSGAVDKAGGKQGTPSKPGMKARAAALFKPGGGSAADGTPKVTS